jgi:hypothetical protein
MIENALFSFSSDFIRPRTSNFNYPGTWSFTVRATGCLGALWVVHREIPYSIDHSFVCDQRKQHLGPLTRTRPFLFLSRRELYLTISWGNLEGGDYAGRVVAELASNLRYHSLLKAISRQVDSI